MHLIYPFKNEVFLINQSIVSLSNTVIILNKWVVNAFVKVR